jgi:hypothetical protein
MVSQIACVLAPVIGNGTPITNPYRPQFASIMQSGEAWSFTLTDLPLVGNLLGDDPLNPTIEPVPTILRTAGQVALGVCIVYVQADSARLDSADGLAAYHVFWRWTINRAEKPSNDTEKSPFKNPVQAELLALRDYLALQTSKSNTVITSWLAQHFETTPANAVTWATARERYRTITKLGQAFYDWNVAKAQLDALG